MNADEKIKILEQAKNWFRETIVENHIKNTKKLISPDEFNINPFLAGYLANFLCGDSTPTSISRGLVLARALATSITTSFGTNIQKFTIILRENFGSTTSGIDIEFIDQIDGEKKYCQLKLGPNTINKDDVETIAGHFKGVQNLARTNGIRIHKDQMIVGVVYGSPDELSSHYNRITKDYDYPVVIGKDFWHRLTGDENFYFDLFKAIASVVNEINASEILEDVISQLSENKEIIKLSSYYS